MPLLREVRASRPTKPSVTVVFVVAVEVVVVAVVVGSSSCIFELSSTLPLAVIIMMRVFLAVQESDATTETSQRRQFRALTNDSDENPNQFPISAQAVISEPHPPSHR